VEDIEVQSGGCAGVDSLEGVLALLSKHPLFDLPHKELTYTLGIAGIVGLGTGCMVEFLGDFAPFFSCKLNSASLAVFLEGFGGAIRKVSKKT